MHSSSGMVLLTTGKFANLSRLSSLRFITTTKSNSYSSSSKSNSALSHYEILGIKKDASSEDVRNAFLRLSKHYHPDINISDPQNHTKFVEINEAYSVLSKPLSRREYDNGMMSAKFHSENLRRQRQYSSGDIYYHQPFHERQAYTDPQFYANRDKSQDDFYARQPYYGVSGISKVSDRKIVYICIGVLLVGAAFHFFVAKTMSDITIENLNARDKKSHEIWKNANDPNYMAEQLERINVIIAENEAKKKQK